MKVIIFLVANLAEGSIKGDQVLLSVSAWEKQKLMLKKDDDAQQLASYVSKKDNHINRKANADPHGIASQKPCDPKPKQDHQSA